MTGTERIAQGTHKLAVRFAATKTIADHLNIVDDAEVQRQIGYLRRSAQAQWADVLKPAIDESWRRTRAAAQAALQPQEDAMSDQPEQPAPPFDPPKPEPTPEPKPDPQPHIPPAPEA